MRIGDTPHPRTADLSPYRISTDPARITLLGRLHDPADRAACLTYIGQLKTDMQASELDYPGALKALNKAAELTIGQTDERAFVGMIYQSQARSHNGLKNPTEGDLLARKAIAHEAKRHGPDHISLAHSHLTLGNSLTLLNKLDDAEAAIAEATRVLHNCVGKDHFLLGLTFLRTSEIEARRRNIDGQIEAYQQMGDLMARQKQPVSYYCFAHMGLGQLKAMVGAHDEALHALQKVLSYAVAHPKLPVSGASQGAALMVPNQIGSLLATRPSGELSEELDLYESQYRQAQVTQTGAVDVRGETRSAAPTPQAVSSPTRDSPHCGSRISASTSGTRCAPCRLLRSSA